MQKTIYVNTCKICGKKEKYLGRHLLYHHAHMNLEEYYKKYYNCNNICLVCKKPTKFQDIKNGFRRFCSKKCCARKNALNRIGTHPWNEKQKREMSRKRLLYLQTPAGQKDILNLSLKRKGKNNPVHRQSLETKMACKIKQSNTMKEKIRKGEFTPPITNSWANSKIRFKIEDEHCFRSTWEAAFYILNPKILYEKTRIPYIHTDGIQRNYIVDFTDVENKILFEIKPDATKDLKNNINKRNAAILWCKQNGYIYKMINNDYFKENAKKINYINYPNKLKKGMEQFL